MFAFKCRVHVTPASSHYYDKANILTCCVLVVCRLSFNSFFRFVAFVSPNVVRVMFLLHIALGCCDDCDGITSELHLMDYMMCWLFTLLSVVR